MKQRLQKWRHPEASAPSRDISLETLSKGAPQNRSNHTASERDANVIASEEQRTTMASSPAFQRRPPSNPDGSTNYIEGRNFQKQKKPRRFNIMTCPWCIYVSWALVIAVSGISAFFIVLYGLSYGYQTSVEWLVASGVSFLENVFCISVLKISFFAAVNTIRPKHYRDIIWVTQKKDSEIKLAKERMSADAKRETHLKLAKLRGTKQYKAPDAAEIAVMMKRAKIRAAAFAFLKGFISHLVFLTLLLNFIYSSENANSFHYNQFMLNQFSPRLSSVDKLEHIYLWVKDSFLPLIHNEVQPTFLSGSRSKIIGLPRMRQVRANGTRKICFHPHSYLKHFVISKSHCLYKRGSDNADESDYAGTWTTLANQSVPKVASSYDGFTYQRNTTQWKYYSYGQLHTYGPAGYTFYFFPEEGRPNSTMKLDALQQRNWLNENTWAVIVELTTFNSDSNLFCTISVVFELSDFGNVKQRLSVSSFALPIFHEQTQAQKLAFGIILVFLLAYVTNELHTIVQEKKDYIRKVSNINNFGLKSALLLLVCLKITKFKMGEDIVKFHLLHPDDFTHFHAVAHLDQILRTTTGILAFLVVLKTIKYIQVFFDMRVVQRSILSAVPGLSSMAVVMLVYFFVFAAFGYLVFGQHEQRYSNMIDSAQRTVLHCISAIRDAAFASSDSLGGLYLAAFMVVMNCVLINLFKAVLMFAHGHVKQRVSEEPSDEAQVLSFLLQNLRSAFYGCIRKTPKSREADLLTAYPTGTPKEDINYV